MGVLHPCEVVRSGSLHSTSKANEWEDVLLVPEGWIDQVWSTSMRSTCHFGFAQYILHFEQVMKTWFTIICNICLHDLKQKLASIAGLQLWSLFAVLSDPFWSTGTACAELICGVPVITPWSFFQFLHLWLRCPPLLQTHSDFTLFALERHDLDSDPTSNSWPLPRH